MEERSGATEYVVVCGCTPCSYFDLKLIYGVPDLQGTDRGHRAHLQRGSRPVAGANCSAPHRVTLTLLFDSYLSMSFSSTMIQKNLLLKMSYS
jgi:hypothetical protein